MTHNDNENGVMKTTHYCIRCGHEFKLLGDLKRHLAKTKECTPLYSNVDRAALLASLKTYDGKKASKTLTIVPAPVEDADVTIVPLDEIDDKDAFILKMQHDHAALRHDHAALRQNHAALQHENVKLKHENAELKQQVGGVTNNNNIVNHITHIHVNNFGQENLEYVTPDFLSRTLKKIYDSVPRLLKHIHFNPEHPENHNIRMPNKRDKYMLVRRDGEWRHEDRRQVLDRLVEHGHGHFDAGGLDGMPAFQRQSIESYLAKMDAEDEEARSHVRSRVEVMLLDSRVE